MQSLIYLSKNIPQDVSGDSLQLTLDSALTLHAPSAVIIDVMGKAVQQIRPRFEADVSLAALRPGLYAVRWRYQGRKVIEQAFEVRR